MTRAPVDLPAPAPSPRHRPPAGLLAVAAVGVLALFLPACGGDDDDASSSTSSTSPDSVVIAPASSSTSPTTSTTAPPVDTTAPPLDLVTDGATLKVANASGVDGAAGRMSEALQEAGFTTADAGNSTEGPLATSKVYYAPANDAAKAVADSVRLALGGGDIEVVELPSPAPLQDPELGDATIVVAMGNDIADTPLDELQGLVPSSDDSSADGGSTGESTTEQSVSESSTDSSDG